MQKRLKRNSSLHKKTDKEIKGVSFSINDATSYPNDTLKLRTTKNIALYKNVDEKISKIEQTKLDDDYVNTYSVLKKIDKNYFGKESDVSLNPNMKKQINKKLIVSILVVLIILIIGLAVIINA